MSNIVKLWSSKPPESCIPSSWDSCACSISALVMLCIAFSALRTVCCSSTLGGATSNCPKSGACWLRNWPTLWPAPNASLKSCSNCICWAESPKSCVASSSSDSSASSICTLAVWVMISCSTVWTSKNSVSTCCITCCCCCCSCWTSCCCTSSRLTSCMASCTLLVSP